MKLFIAGPFRSAAGNNYRETECAQFMQNGFQVVDPIKEVGDLRNIPLEQISKQIVWGDTRLVSQCDVIIAYAFRSSTGTGMEAMAGALLGKPLVVVTFGNANVSPFIVYFADLIVEHITVEHMDKIRALKTTPGKFKKLWANMGIKVEVND